MPTIELERTLVKSPPELWDEIASQEALARWLPGVRLGSLDPPSRIEWNADGVRGVIELEASGWGTRIRAQAARLPVGGVDRSKQTIRRCFRSQVGCQDFAQS